MELYGKRNKIRSSVAKFVFRAFRKRTPINPMKLKAGKAYKIFHPNGGGEKEKIHIDYILDNPTNELWYYKIIVYRACSKFKKRWRFYASTYFSIAAHNNWNLNELESL